ncbi:MAG: hypothetical protein ACRBCL_14640 [Maritimibacter sp.]
MTEIIGIFGDGFSLGSIAASIVATIVSILAGYYFRIFREWRRMRFIRRVWFPVSKGAKVDVYLTIREGPASHRSKRLSLPEVLALKNIERRAKEIDASLNIISNPVEERSSEKSHLILLGGPKKNALADEVWTEALSRAPFGFSEDFGKLQSATQTYEPLMGKDGTWDYDFALVAKLRRNDSGSFVFVFAGCHGLGTGGSTRLMTEDHLLKPLAASVGAAEFFSVVRVNGKNGMPVEASIEEIYQLPKR